MGRSSGLASTMSLRPSLEYVRSYDDGPAGRRAHVVREPLQHLRLRARDEAGDDLEVYLMGRF